MTCSRISMGYAFPPLDAWIPFWIRYHSQAIHHHYQGLQRRRIHHNGITVTGTVWLLQERRQQATWDVRYDEAAFDVWSITFTLPAKNESLKLPLVRIYIGIRRKGGFKQISLSTRKIVCFELFSCPHEKSNWFGNCSTHLQKSCSGCCWIHSLQDSSWPNGKIVQK